MDPWLTQGLHRRARTLSIQDLDLLTSSRQPAWTESRKSLIAVEVGKGTLVAEISFFSLPGAAA